MENRLTAARIPDADKVDVVKIQLIGVARLWWIAEENHLARPITWKAFSDSFLAKFFPDTVKDEMEKKFINLEQDGFGPLCSGVYQAEPIRSIHDSYGGEQR